MKMGEKIYNLRMKNNMTLEELGDRVGVGKSTVRKWEKGLIANMKRDKIAKLASALGVSPAYLMGWEDVPFETPVTLYDVKADPKRIPIIGKIAAGVPISAIEEHDEWFDIDRSINADFALRVKGDSMINANIFDGDIAFFRAQNTLESGEIGVFIIDDEATLKRYRVYDDFALLEPANPDYKAIVVNAVKQANIQGKLVGVYSEKRN